MPLDTEGEALAHSAQHIRAAWGSQGQAASFLPHCLQPGGFHRHQGKRGISSPEEGEHGPKAGWIQGSICCPWWPILRGGGGGHGADGQRCSFWSILNLQKDFLGDSLGLLVRRCSSQAKHKLSLPSPTQLHNRGIGKQNLSFQGALSFLQCPCTPILVLSPAADSAMPPTSPHVPTEQLWSPRGGWIPLLLISLYLLIKY